MSTITDRAPANGAAVTNLSAVLDALKAQRNGALDQLAHVAGLLAVAQERIAQLEARLAELEKAAAEPVPAPAA